MDKVEMVTNSRRLKDVELTKRSIGYFRYAKTFSKKDRVASLKDEWCPKTPDVNQKASCSAWNKKLKKWRRCIHNWTNLDEEEFQKLSLDPSTYFSLPISKISKISFERITSKTHPEIIQKILLPEKSDHTLNSIKETEIPTYFIPKQFNGSNPPERFNIIFQEDFERAHTALAENQELQRKIAPQDLYDINIWDTTILSENRNKRNPNLQIKKHNLLINKKYPQLDENKYLKENNNSNTLEDLLSWHTSLRYLQILSLCK